MQPSGEGDAAFRDGPGVIQAVFDGVQVRAADQTGSVQDPAGVHGAHDNQRASLEEGLVGGSLSGAPGVLGPVDSDNDAARFDPIGHAPSMRAKRRDRERKDVPMQQDLRPLGTARRHARWGP